jgi:nitroreductase
MFNNNDGDCLALLQSRRSVVARQMMDPGPTESELRDILEAAIRVPDHGKLNPWRLCIFSGVSSEQLGTVMSESYLEENESPSEKVAQNLLAYPAQAPVMIAVISKPSPENQKIPLWEQQLSAGAVCQNMLIASTAMGFACQWLTGVGAYSAGVHRHLNMTAGDQIAGFIFIGSSDGELKERPRPEFEQVVSFF